MICLGRDEDTEIVKIAMIKGKIDPQKFILIEEGLASVSSTEIRKEIQAGNYGKLKESGWLHPHVVDYIKKMGKDIFAKK